MMTMMGELFIAYEVEIEARDTVEFLSTVAQSSGVTI